MTHRPHPSATSQPFFARSRALVLPWFLVSGLLVACTDSAGHPTPSGDTRGDPSAAAGGDGQASKDASRGTSDTLPTDSGSKERDAGVPVPDAASTVTKGTDASSLVADAAAPSAAVDAGAGPEVRPASDAGGSSPPVAAQDAGAPRDAAGPVASIYDDDEKWLCHPGMAKNPCLDTIQVTDVHPDGGTTVAELPKTPADVVADCLYLYPSVDPGLLTPPRNLDFDQIDKTTIRDLFAGQGVPFREACAIWAPFYRQASLNSFEQDDTREKGLETAFRDLDAAFDFYLRHANPDRPIVIIAHSQGSIVMSRLLKRRFEGHPELLQRLVVAVLAGPLGGFTVPDKKLVGGTLQEIPLCTSDEQNGCVLTFSTFGAKVAPNADYGRVNGGVPAGFDLGCTTPPGGLDGAPARLSGTLFASTSGVLGFLGPVFDYGAARVKTQLARYADFYTGRCERTSRGLSYFKVVAAPLPGDVRVDPVPYDNGVLNSGELGLHAIDYAFVSGDLLRSVKTRLLAHKK